ncbi:TonB-dependent receptor [Fulvivirga sp.]|uniref:TonB-dependent receptor n=1 Tax=Fulvivirga sp. TaxID=1931237 RepID=UPI0032EB91C1
MRLSALVLLFSLITSFSSAQGQVISGAVTNQAGLPLEGVNITLKGQNKGTATDSEGRFTLSLSNVDSIIIVFSFVGYVSAEKEVTQTETNLNIVLIESTELLDEIKVTGNRDETVGPSVTKLDPKSAELLPTPFREFNKILVTLPGVVSNNELSSTYSVRGGNFDENLVYVNDIPIYRPFLVTNGQQEGLSFINSDLVSSVEFSAGGWQAKYGDKLASVLNVKYKTPEKFAGSISGSLLGGSIHFEGATNNERLNYTVGARHKSSRYLLNTLETNGQYLPKFTDYQSYINFNVGKKEDKNRTTIGLLTAYARNRYEVTPESRETEFGNFNQSLRLYVAFVGKELLEYDTYQGGIKLNHRINKTWRTQLITSVVKATEREYTEVEGGYRLCDVDKNLSSSTFNDCVFTRGIGTNYDYGRNSLEAEIVNAENRNVIFLDNATVEFGLGYSRQLIEDQLQEYDFTDSADYVTQINAVQANNRIESNQYTAFVQSTVSLSKSITTTFGVRGNYWDLNEQFLISPRWQISIKPDFSRKVTFSGAVGIYQQPPFFRELRNFDGVLNTKLKAQQSLHIIGGVNYGLTWWGRPFILTSEVYYKKIKNVVPYEVDNVKVRYYANNDAEAYAAGFDMRISGEFIEGAESWFSLGVLNVREDVEGDGKGYIRRPSDQRLNVAVFFQDHIPNNPDIRVNLNFLYGSGLPFGAPGNFQRRNSFNGDAYTRIDMGFSRLFHLKSIFNNDETLLTISAEILNLFGSDNAISYTWIADVNNNQYAVPNSLSARFLNIRARVRL